MGGGGLLQLVAVGAQDALITGTPSITFFKLMYRRHTAFALEQVRQTFTGNAAIGSRPQVVISRNGDLLRKVFLEFTVPACVTNAVHINKMVYKVIESVTLEVGGQKIDSLYGRSMELMSHFHTPAAKQMGIDKNTVSLLDADPLTGVSLGEEQKVVIPLDFSFSTSPGLALPLISLQYHEVKLLFDFSKTSESELSYTGVSDHTSVVSPAFGAHLRPSEFTGTYNGPANLVVATATTSGTTATCSLDNFEIYADYIFLDTSERRRFAQSSHEYLITQLQFTGADTSSSTGLSNLSTRLAFNHPVKCLYFAFQQDDNAHSTAFATASKPGRTDTNSNAVLMDPFFYGMLPADESFFDCANDPIDTVKLQLNGHDRFSERGAQHFRLTQPLMHHPRIPKSFVHAYSFSLNNNEMQGDTQPSGTLNFSRIDNATLQVGFKSGKSAGKMYIYAVSYNIFRVLSGMGGLAFSN